MERMHDPAHPGEILREELEARGATITGTARALGVTRKALSDIVNLKAGVSPVMARRLEAARRCGPVSVEVTAVQVHSSMRRAFGCTS